MSKSPAFQLYAADFDMDTGSWTATQVGVYTRLLLSAWVNGSLPNTISGLARIARIDVRNMHKMWSAVIAKKFTTDAAGMYVNPRMEIEREKQAIYKEVQSKKGVAGNKIKWKDHVAAAIPVRSPEDRSSSSSSTSIKNKEKNRGFHPPSAIEVSAYCQERKNQVTVQTFISHYESNGWMIGKNKMKDWKAAVRTWETRGGNGNGSGYSGRPGAAYPQTRRGKDEPTGGFGIPKEYKPEAGPIISDEERTRNLAKLRTIING